MKDQSTALVLFGPTGVGKSALALSLAHEIPSAIINLDVGQLYTPLTIGTAKPDWKASDAPHYLYDFVDQPRNITVVEYRTALEAVLTQCYSQNRLPIIVGGAGFYLKTLLFPPHDFEYENDYHVQSHTTDELWHQLQAIDPERAAQIHPHDRYRIIRALEIWHGSGTPPSAHKPLFDPLCRLHIVFVTRERQELYRLINERVEQMMGQGWLAEVAALQGSAWEPFIMQKKLIGYDDLISYLKYPEKESLKLVVERIAQKTRHYAKRQITWWRSLVVLLATVQKEMEKPIVTTQEINLTFTDLSLYIKQLLAECIKMGII